MEDQNKVTKTPKREQKETIKQKLNQRKTKTAKLNKNKIENQGNKTKELKHIQEQSKIFTTNKYSQNHYITNGDHSQHGSTNPKLLLKIDHLYIHSPKYPQPSTKGIRKKS